MLCLRPENADLLAASSWALSAAASALASYVAVPGRFSEPGIDRRADHGPGVYVPPPAAGDPLAFEAAALTAIVPPCPRRVADGSPTIAYREVLIWADAWVNGLTGIPPYERGRFERILAENVSRQRGVGAAAPHRGLLLRRVPAASSPRTVAGVTKPQIPAPTVEKTDEQWRAELSPAEYQVLRQAGTERPWTGEYVENHRTGVYRCRACGSELFRSDTKFDSHCGWPSFWSPLAGERVILREDSSLGTTRVEVLCANCHSHLGHVFHGEGYGTPTDDRYCINSISLTFEDEPAS